MNFTIIMKKELRRVFKDKKMVFSLFILPLITVTGISVLVFSLINNLQDDIESHVSTVFVQNAPEDFQQLLDRDSDMSVTYLDRNEDTEYIKEDILHGATDLLVVFPDSFSDEISNATQTETSIPQVMTFYNPSEDYSQEARSRFVNGYLESYRQMKVQERFGSIEYAQIFTVDSDNDSSMIQDEARASGKMIGMFVPYFITIMLFAGAMSMGVDVMTGEKERGTMASLLLSPVKRSEIAFGKVAALGLLSSMSAMVYAVAMLITLPIAVSRLGVEGLLDGFTISFSPLQIVQIFLLLIGIVLLYVGIVSIVAVMAKTVKEAQTYVSLLYMVVLVSSMITMYTPEVKSLAGFLIPVYNTSAAFKGIFAQTLTPAAFLLTIGMTYLLDILLVLGIAQAFKSEKVMI